MRAKYLIGLMAAIMAGGIFGGLAIAQQYPNLQKGNTLFDGLIYVKDKATIKKSLELTGSDIKGIVTTGTSTTQTYTATVAGNNVIIVTGEGTTTVALPTAVGGTGTTFIVFAGGTTSVYIDPDGSETLNGAATGTITAQYNYKRVISDGSNWYVIGNE